ncbi:four helix bundle protein [Pedobacter soli]|uniref:Four helix bundle protein n=1 Tax=Pedobacter soli TaxID=390242 RepID=A0A1G7CRV0_9SPHI|nr:four helix bundle protein [Pedobacter soli]SDE41386.1 four helix bundle protein [Pedobacter soli]
MAKVERFEDLEIWQLAKQIGVEAYRISDIEPMKSDFGLKDQFRRAAMSMSDNVAEGFEYNNNADFIRVLVYAKGSSGEFRNKLIILEEAGKLSTTDYKLLYEKCIEFSAKTKRFIDYLKDFEQKKKALKKRNNSI